MISTLDSGALVPRVWLVASSSAKTKLSISVNNGQWKKNMQGVWRVSPTRFLRCFQTSRTPEVGFTIDLAFGYVLVMLAFLFLLSRLVKVSLNQTVHKLVMTHYLFLVQNLVIPGISWVQFEFKSSLSYLLQFKCIDYYSRYLIIHLAQMYCLLHANKVIVFQSASQQWWWWGWWWWWWWWWW